MSVSFLGVNYGHWREAQQHLDRMEREAAWWRSRYELISRRDSVSAPPQDYLTTNEMYREWTYNQWQAAQQRLEDYRHSLTRSQREQCATQQTINVHQQRLEWPGRYEASEMPGEFYADTTDYDYRDPVAANERAEKLFKAQLTEAERKQWYCDGYLEIKGKSRFRYRIYRINHIGALNHNIVQYQEETPTAPVYWRRICFLPDQDLPYYDVILTQKLALELRERDVLNVAHAIDWHCAKHKALPKYL